MAHKEFSRRDFIQQITIATGGCALLSTLPGFTEIAPEMQNKKLGIALVGLGSYSSGQLAPALQETKDCYLAGIVTGTPSKEKD